MGRGSGRSGCGVKVYVNRDVFVKIKKKKLGAGRGWVVGVVRVNVTKT